MISLFIDKAFKARASPLGPWSIPFTAVAAVKQLGAGYLRAMRSRKPAYRSKRKSPTTNNLAGLTLAIPVKTRSAVSVRLKMRKTTGVVS